MRELKERDIEKYLARRVKELGGAIRKVKWLGIANAPDRLVMFKGPHFVELKKPGEKPRPAQEREFNRMDIHGVRVDVLSTIAEVDEFITRIAHERKKL